MERWSGRVALVTGASAGIGAAITKELVLKGMKVVGVARRLDRMEAMKTDLQSASGELYPLKCDVSQENDILAVFDWINKNLGGVDVLVNNAGVGHSLMGLTESSTDKWRQTFDVNVMAVNICTREAVKSMRARGVDDGHIIHINSIAGHKIVNFPGTGIGMYTASKFALKALTESLRMELLNQKSRIKISSISPGTVKTEIKIAAGRVKGMEAYDNIPYIEAKELADSVLHVLGTPPHVQIYELIIFPVGEPF